MKGTFYLFIYFCCCFANIFSRCAAIDPQLLQNRTWRTSEKANERRQVSKLKFDKVLALEDVVHKRPGKEPPVWQLVKSDAFFTSMVEIQTLCQADTRKTCLPFKARKAISKDDSIFLWLLCAENVTLRRLGGGVLLRTVFEIRMDLYMDGQMRGWINGQLTRMDGCVHAWMNGWLAGLMDSVSRGSGWVWVLDGWMEW